MNKSILEKIYDKINKLEKEKRDYLEVGKMNTVCKKESEPEILNLALDGLSYKTVKRELEQCRKFIREKGLKQEFERKMEE